jgi:protoporphyrinogen oxidase
MDKKKVVVLGGGITGLVAAYYFSQDPDFEVTLIEKQKKIGGSAFTFLYKDFILDYGPHKLYTELPGIFEEIKKVTPLLKIKKKNSIYLRENLYNFPLQLSQIATKMPVTAVKAGLDIFQKPFCPLPDDSYENFLLNRFGRTMYELSFKDYAQKVWGSDPKQLDKELAIRRVAISNVFELIKGILIKDTQKISAEYFAYPPKGIKQLLDNLVKKIRESGGKVLSETQASEIKITDNKVEYIKIKKTKIKPDYVVSTIFLDELVKTITDKTKTPEISGASKKLDYQKVSVLYLVLNKKRALKDCWIFFPEKKFFFHRVSEQKAFSLETSPKDKTVLMIETTKEPTKETINKMVNQLISLDIIKKQDILDSFIKTSEKVYPLYRKGFLPNLNKVLGYLDRIENFFTIGRPGLFNYNNMDQCWDMALKTYQHIKENKSPQDWQNTKKYFDKYRIVD